MEIKGLINSIEIIPIQLFANLENREVAIWLRDIPEDLTDENDRNNLISFLRLPWRLVILETNQDWLINSLENPSNELDHLIRKRGFCQIIDKDPSHIQLPPRCLPIFLFNGRNKGSNTNAFERQLRQITMLDALRRSNLKDLLVLSFNESPIPKEFDDLWNTGFKANLNFITNHPSKDEILENWKNKFVGVVTFLKGKSASLINDFVTTYLREFPTENLIVRMKDQKGGLHKVDLTDVDDPETPILDRFSMVLDRDLSPLTPGELKEEEFINFFKNPELSWRPYAAGLPWRRDTIQMDKIEDCLKNLDNFGCEHNKVGYFSVQPGSGGTSLLRDVAWHFAQRGYPALVAKSIPFQANSVEINNFLLRVNRNFNKQPLNQVENEKDENYVVQHYELPWILIFDRLHWEYRESELKRFCKELQRLGRPILILIVTDSTLSNTLSEDRNSFELVGELKHILSSTEALSLGTHLNQFLKHYGKERKEYQWESFFDQHTVKYGEVNSFFWIALSFWIQGQYDLSITIQDWIYKALKAKDYETSFLEVLFEIAALSSERLPFPSSLLPYGNGQFPISYSLENCQNEVPSLGLVSLRDGNTKYWAQLHDILGRFLINALFHDREMLKKLSLGEATDPDHLRFILLSKIALKPEIGEIELQTIGEDFATTVFKIDPDRGKLGFAKCWREVFRTLDSMSPSLRKNSRVFLHHSAISRRRIARQIENSLFDISYNEKVALLRKAIEDIEYALHSINYTPGSESNLNLYNSLARAYFDLADIEEKNGETKEEVLKLREKGNLATRKAFEESPTNSYVLETYVRNLLVNAKSFPSRALDNCIEALITVFSAISSREENYRLSALSGLADDALNILKNNSESLRAENRPSNATEVLVAAWKALSHEISISSCSDFSKIPENNRISALRFLELAEGQGNIQVTKLRYQVLCATFPKNFELQLELVEQLEKSMLPLNPQQKLEYAILLFQNSRAIEGAKVFSELRKLWSESDLFVQIPSRLRWLWTPDHKNPKRVYANLFSNFEFRAFAKVNEFSGIKVPLRLEEFGIRKPQSGYKFTSYVSFTHNGPFLRPIVKGIDSERNV